MTDEVKLNIRVLDDQFPYLYELEDDEGRQEVLNADVEKKVHVLVGQLMAIWNYAGYALMMRNTMVDTLDEEYITTATVKGLSERTIMFKHAARNAMLPVVTQITLSLGFTLSGSIFTETVFSYPGVGLLAYDAVMSRDYPLSQGVLLISAVAVILVNLFADVIYARLDPRVRF